MPRYEGNTWKVQNKIFKTSSLKFVIQKIFEKKWIAEGFNNFFANIEIVLANKVPNPSRPFNSYLRGHSKMMSLRKWQILDPPPPYVTVSHFFSYSLLLCRQANSEKHLSCFVKLICNWHQWNRSTNEPITCLKIDRKRVPSLLPNLDLI